MVRYLFNNYTYYMFFCKQSNTVNKVEFIALAWMSLELRVGIIILFWLFNGNEFSGYALDKSYTIYDIGWNFLTVFTNEC